MWWKMDFIQQPATTGLVVEPRTPKHFQSQTCTKKRSRPLFGDLLPIWFTKAFWILAKSVHLRSMLSKLMRYTENCNAYNQHWSTEWDQFFSRTTPDHMSHNQGAKSWTNWATKFCFIHHVHLTSHQFTDSSIVSTTFCKENASTTSRRQKMLFPKILLNPKAWTFMLQKKVNLFHKGKNVLTVKVAILINKDVFVPSYVI